MLAPERNDENMERRDFPQKPHSAAESKREYLPLGLLTRGTYKMSRVCALVKSIAGCETQINEAIKLFLGQADEVADHIRDEVPIWLMALKAEWQ